MEVQNISGTDIISSKMDVNPRITNENARSERKEIPEAEINPESTKGRIIDTKA